MLNTFLQQFDALQFEKEAISQEDEVAAIHSGNIGDIIYSLPTCYHLGVNHLILSPYIHPFDARRVLTKKSAEALVPLLLKQEAIKKVSVLDTGPGWELAKLDGCGISYNLDKYRLTTNTATRHLAYSHAAAFDVIVDGKKPWLHIPESCNSNHLPCSKKEKYVVITLTDRYRSYDQALYATLLDGIPAELIYFVGLPQDEINYNTLEGNRYCAKNLLDLALFIKNAALFIGNPSGAYAIAEAIKTPRLIELPPIFNVYPFDESGTLLNKHSLKEHRQQLFQHLGIENQLSLHNVTQEKNEEKKPSGRINTLMTAPRKILRKTLFYIANNL